MRPKNVILLEINIVVTNINDVDLLYYLLLDAFARRLRVWCTMVAMERCWPPSLSLLAPSCLIFLRSVCFCFHVARGFKAFLGPVALIRKAQCTPSTCPVQFAINVRQNREYQYSFMNANASRYVPK